MSASSDIQVADPRRHVPGVGVALRFFVPGTPRPQGSVRPMVSKGTGRAFVKQSPVLAEWRNAIYVVAREAMEDTPEWAPSEEGPVRLMCVFGFKRPKSHSKARRAEDRGIKYDGPDIDKLVRAVGDGLTVAGVYEDDRQIAVVQASKVYVEQGDGVEGAWIVVTRVAR